MTPIVFRLLASFLLALLAAGTAGAGTVTGVVRNGTTGAPAAGADVVLIQLQGGMQTVASTRTDTHGRYRIEHAGLGRLPMLIRVNYRGVNFHQSLPPGRETADVEVFEATADPRVLQVTSRLIVLQPNGSVLLVGEEYSVQNRATPPAAFYIPEGSFEFQVPEGGELAQVSAWGPSAMPVVQGTIDRGARRYAIAFAFRPGKSGVRLSYQMPYAANQITLRAASPYAAGRVLVLAPPTMQVAGQGFQSAGTEQGWSVYARDAVPAAAPLDISISGSAPPPSASGQRQEDVVNGRDSGTPIQALPSRLDSLKWILVGGLGALFALGIILLWRRPAGAAINAPVSPMSSSRTPRIEQNDREAGKLSHAIREMDQDVSRSLDELKDTLFRLELRRQAGTISGDEYARERGRAEKVLRDLVKG